MRAPARRWKRSRTCGVRPISGTRRSACRPPATTRARARDRPRLAAAGHAVEQEGGEQSSLARTAAAATACAALSAGPGSAGGACCRRPLPAPVHPAPGAQRAQRLSGVRGASIDELRDASPSGARAEQRGECGLAGARASVCASSRPAPSAASDRAATASAPCPDAAAAAAPRRPPPRSGAGSSARPSRGQLQVGGRRAAARRPDGATRLSARPRPARGDLNQDTAALRRQKEPKPTPRGAAAHRRCQLAGIEQGADGPGTATRRSG